MTSSRAARRLARYLPETIPADDNDLDHRIVCPICGGIYLVVGERSGRRIRPQHEPTCTRYRRPTEPTPEQAAEPTTEPTTDPATEGDHMTDNDPGRITRRVDLDAEALSKEDYRRAVADYLLGPRPPEHLRPTPEAVRARLLGMNADAKRAAENATAVHSRTKWAVLSAQLERAGLTSADVPWLTVVPINSEGGHRD